MAEDGKPAPERRGAKAKTPRVLWPYAVVVALALAVGLLVERQVFNLWILGAHIMCSGGMKDTLLVGDWFYTNKITYRLRDPRPGEIVSFTYPYREATTAEKINRVITMKYGAEGSGCLFVIIGRVVGGPGDVLELKEGVLHRNGEPVYEPYVLDDAGADWGPYEVPPASYFVMGDNRNDSADSRFTGPVPRKYVGGRVTSIYFSVAPVLCPRHQAPIVQCESGWYCTACGEEMRPGLDFEPAPRWRLDRRVRWERLSRPVNALPRNRFSNRSE